MDDGFVQRSAVGAEERRENAHAVFAGVGRELRAEEIGAGGEEIDVADCLGARGGGFDFSGPAGEKGHAVAALPDVGLVAAELRAGEVALFFEGGCAGLRRAAVVGGEDDERVGGEAVFVEGGEDFSDDGIGLHDKIAVGAETALPCHSGVGRIGVCGDVSGT